MLSSLRRTLVVALLLILAALAIGPVDADGPKDNLPDNVRPIPPKGTALPPEVVTDLRNGLADLQRLIKAIGTHEFLPDVLIYEKAVRWALDYDEVFDPKGKNVRPGANVRKVLAAGLERAKQLKDGQTPWTKQTGPVLRGYKSHIDGSVQPYWLIVPADYDFSGKSEHRLDVWWHGRGETLSEANFMANPANASGIIPAPGAFILHPYGRYCNANKFAGEVDTFECLGHAAKYYRIDRDRLVARGFSMGGAACWQFGVHYPTMWAACAPGAGFSETPEFLRVFQNENVDDAPWYEKKLWHMYDATDYAANLFNLPTVAYSGEIDRQKQAADIMEKAMAKEGLKLTHIIGPKTAHSYEKTAKEEVNRRIDAIVANGKPHKPKEVKFVTYTLQYGSCGFIGVRQLEKHWEETRIEAKLDGETPTLKTKNVVAFWFHPSDSTQVKKVIIDGVELPPAPPKPALSPFYYRKVDGMWQPDPAKPESGLVKDEILHGPIDDAFMDSFVFVRPTAKPMNEAMGAWAEKEMKHAITHWRSQFRGDAPVKSDTQITKDDIANNNLILWGDPMSNSVLAKIADKLPIKWTEKGVTVGDKTYAAGTHVPVLIFPNPLNPEKYVVINSGFTYREYDYLNNARQVPKLPDYAVIDITTPPNSRYPGKIVRAGFFGERWELLPDDGRN